jgi:hypothetical protein
MRFILSASLMMLASQVQAQALYTASRLTHFAGLAADLRTTEVFRTRGILEANPILGQNRYRRLALASGSALTSDFVIGKWVRPKHPRVATVFNFAAGWIHLGIAYNNRRNLPTFSMRK